LLLLFGAAFPDIANCTSTMRYVTNMEPSCNRIVTSRGIVALLTRSGKLTYI
jgi:hypothetical protein